MSKVVFVGNVPYNMGEEQLIDVFRSVGQVVGFRLVFDRETGKPKGYGFCEFTDHETAMSAVRNLNNTDVGGRPLRIDLADSDPFLEGKTTVHGEILDGGSETRAQWRERREREDKDEVGGFLSNLPPGIPPAAGMTSMDAITQTIATAPPATMYEVLAQMKAFVINHPEQARILLQAYPQLAQALFQALITTNIVDPMVLEKMRDSATAPAVPAVPQGPPMNMGPPPVIGQTPVPPAQQYQPYPPSAYPPPPIQNQQPPFYQAPPQHTPTPPIPQQATVPPTVPVAAPPLAQPPQLNLPANIDPNARAILEQVFALTPDQMALLPAHEQEAIKQMKFQFGGAIPS